MSCTYESLKCQTLREFGFPEDELWLTECHATQDLARYYDLETVFDLDIQEDFVLYHHESGSITAIAGFNNLDEFVEACSYLASAFRRN